MYAVVSTGGKQIRVEEGDVVRVEKLDADVGDTVELDEVRLLAKDDSVVVDPDALEGTKVVCQVSGQGRGKKIRVFKMKRRKGYKRTYGHRQDYTELQVQTIQG
ncbi:MAG: 50S ribosomal protein L21 [Candidatus Hydrogenedentes bacterium]|jgi:large subunit ribosomal protein L21|nr:50S ribosomal protein L21 [Candidatus Hydrogenedentota bacterium]